jgi:hypothetical protein
MHFITLSFLPAMLVSMTGKSNATSLSPDWIVLTNGTYAPKLTVQAVVQRLQQISYTNPNMVRQLVIKAHSPSLMLPQRALYHARQHNLVDHQGDFQPFVQNIIFSYVKRDHSGRLFISDPFVTYYPQNPQSNWKNWKHKWWDNECCEKKWLHKDHHWKKQHH